MLKLTTLNKNNNKKTKTIIFLLLSSYDTFWNLSVNYFKNIVITSNNRTLRSAARTIESQNGFALSLWFA